MCMQSPFRILSRFLAGFVAVLVLILAACSEPTAQTIQPAPTLAAEEFGDLHIVTGQLVFVPAYSEIISVSNPRLQLSTTLAIHNTDLQHSIIVKSVRYYNTDGELVREFIDAPSELKPMATTGFVIPSDDTSGGWGANFLVEWVASEPVYEPVIEAVMVSTRGNEGVSFISEGRVVSEQQS
jgi:hypothetical protein